MATEPVNAWMAEVIDTVRTLAADLEQVARDQHHAWHEARFLAALQAALREYDAARDGGVARRCTWDCKCAECRRANAGNPR
jgi:hypothetical protein